MTISNESSTLALLDTNVLVYAVDTAAKHHAASQALLNQAAVPDSHLCVSPQNFVEFYAVVTDHRRVKNPQPPSQAAQAIKVFLELPGLALLPVPIDVTKRFGDLVDRYPVVAQHAFDAYLVATMLGNGVTRIYAFNAVHFESFDPIEVLVPAVTARV